MTDKGNWFSRLSAGLSKSATQLTDGITGIFTGRKVDAETIAELEELLITADIGVKTAARLAEGIKSVKVADGDSVRQALVAQITTILEPVAVPFSSGERKPEIILVVGVNGNGKTTTIGKLALQLKGQGKKVLLAAADTFRAAAVEQLQVWGKRADVEVVTGAANSDPASVAFAAVEKARAQQTDVLLIDTAGRLQNKSNLMAELQKIIKVIQKLDPAAPHQVIQVLDATTGQNALSQVETFKELVKVSGLIVTKLDGTAKAGVVVALADRFKLPIHAVGVGEGAEDLQGFNAASFAANLVGLNGEYS